MRQAIGKFRKRFFVILTLLCGICLGIAGCSSVPSSDGKETETFDLSERVFTIDGSTPVASPAPNETEAANRLLRSQMVELLMENQSLKEAVGILISTEEPMDIVRNVMDQLSDLSSQNDSLRMQVAQLQSENNELQQTVSELRNKSTETESQLAQALAKNQALESLRKLSVDLQLKNQLLTNENENLQNLLLTNENSLPVPDQTNELMSRIANLDADNENLRQALSQLQTKGSKTQDTANILLRDSNDPDSLTELNSKLETENELLILQNQFLRKQLVTESLATPSDPVRPLSNLPGSGER